MTKRLQILKDSLKKKQKVLDAKFDNHFADVKRANGQPLNDKRNGHVTLNRWDRQSESIRNQEKEIEKTKNAIETEEGNILETKWWYDRMPLYIKPLIDNGTLIQWQKNPRIMFVKGVDKARISFDEKTGKVSHSYLKSVTKKDQFYIFKNVYNDICNKQT